MRKARILFILIVSLLMAGCGSGRQIYILPGYGGSFYLSPEIKTVPIKRVMVMLFKNETEYMDVEKRMTDMFVLELQKASQFEVISSTPEAEELLSREDLRTKGVFSKDKVARVGDRFNVDALIFGSILQYKPYEPFILGLKAQMVSTDAGKVVWVVEQIFDSDEYSIHRAARTYYSRLNKRSPKGWKIILTSMEQYIKFASYRIVETLNLTSVNSLFIKKAQRHKSHKGARIKG